MQRSCRYWGCSHGISQPDVGLCSCLEQGKVLRCLQSPPRAALGQDLGTQVVSMSQAWVFRSGTPCSLSADCKNKMSDPLVPRAVEPG